MVFMCSSQFVKSNSAKLVITDRLLRYTEGWLVASFCCLFALDGSQATVYRRLRGTLFRILLCFVDFACDQIFKVSFQKRLNIMLRPQWHDGSLMRICALSHFQTLFAHNTKRAGMLLLLLPYEAQS